MRQGLKVAVAKGACNCGKMTLDTGQRPGKTDEESEANRTKDSMMGVTGGRV